VAELVFFTGTMDSGKSTLALQMDHNHSVRGRDGMVFSQNDRAGEGMLSSRRGLTREAREVTAATNFWDEVVHARTHGRRVDYAVCDEVHFYTSDQVEQLARLVDEMDVDVFAFGISTDFRTHLFPGSRRMIELADRVAVLQVEALCWCGSRATHNARTVDGVMVLEGDQVLVGDVRRQEAGVIGYETLCRRHHMRRMTATTGGAGAVSPAVLPLIDTLPAPHTQQ
jgi:thymidine kinase